MPILILHHQDQCSSRYRSPEEGELFDFQRYFLDPQGSSALDVRAIRLIHRRAFTGLDAPTPDEV
jgi:hypothetical protein